MLVAGVDSSTQSTKVEVRDAGSGEVVGRSRAPHPATTPPRSEQDPAAWWAALNQAFDELPRRSEVAAVSVAGQQHGLVLIDAPGGVIRPAKLWNDTESAPQASRLVEERGPQWWADAVGSVPTAAFTISKLAWIVETEPEDFRRAERVLLPHDWLTWRLTERAVTDRGDASGTGYWSPEKGNWCPEALALVDPSVEWEPLLPEVLGPDEPAGTVVEAGEELGLAPGTLVGPGTGDNMAAALGIGLQPGDVAISIGTSGTVFAVSAAPTADMTGAVAGFADATGRFLPLVCTLNATKVTDAFARLLAVDARTFDRLALDAPSGSRGTVLVPYLDGERTPNRPHATGTLSGFRADVSREDLARAAVEGVVCGLLDGLDALGAAGVDTAGRLFLIGGGARSAAYRQILADLAGRPVLVPDPSAEHVAAGAAIQAAAVLNRAEPEAVRENWSAANECAEVEPAPRVDAGGVRAQYRAVASRFAG